MSNLEGEEIFDPSHLGQAEEVIQERVSDDELIFIKGLVCMCDLDITQIITKQYKSIGSNSYMFYFDHKSCHIELIKRYCKFEMLIVFIKV